MGDTATASAEGECRAEHNRISDRVGELNTVFYGIYNLGSCTRLTDFFHGILKCLTILCLKNGLCGCTNQFYSVLF